MSSTHDQKTGIHSHAQVKHGTAFVIGISLNFAFVIIETIYGLLSHSMALVADAGHNLTDVLSLGISWGAAILAARAPTQRRTYGLRSATILAALANAMSLLLITGAIAWESIRRLAAPEPIATKTVIVVALVGVVVNGVSALFFMAGKKGDLNVRSAFLHLVADAAFSLGVAIAGVIMAVTGWRWMDPVVSIGLSIAILVSAWSLLRGSINLALNAVPEGIDPEAVRGYLGGLPNVDKVHDFHIWAMSTTESALTAHLVMQSTVDDPAFTTKVCQQLHEQFGIEHSTIQLDSVAHPCQLEQL